MDLDIYDAIRIGLVVEIDCDHAHHLVEPYEVVGRDGQAILIAYDPAGPSPGWREYIDWSGLKLTKQHFSRRERP